MFREWDGQFVAYTDNDDSKWCPGMSIPDVRFAHHLELAALLEQQITLENVDDGIATKHFRKRLHQSLNAWKPTASDIEEAEREWLERERDEVLEDDDTAMAKRSLQALLGGPDLKAVDQKVLHATDVFRSKLRSREVDFIERNWRMYRAKMESTTETRRLEEKQRERSLASGSSGSVGLGTLHAQPTELEKTPEQKKKQEVTEKAIQEARKSEKTSSDLAFDLAVQQKMDAGAAHAARHDKGAENLRKHYSTYEREIMENACLRNRQRIKTYRRKFPGIFDRMRRSVQEYLREQSLLRRDAELGLRMKVKFDESGVRNEASAREETQEERQRREAREKHERKKRDRAAAGASAISSSPSDLASSPGEQITHLDAGDEIDSPFDGGRGVDERRDVNAELDRALAEAEDEGGRKEPAEGEDESELAKKEPEKQEDSLRESTQEIGSVSLNQDSAENLAGGDSVAVAVVDTVVAEAVAAGEVDDAMPAEPPDPPGAGGGGTEQEG
eukprot:g246.t1